MECMDNLKSHELDLDHAYALRLCLVIQACVYGCLCGGNQEWQLPNQAVAFSLLLQQVAGLE